jgi:ribosomal-protein-alanine N-acetyltransferase
MALVDLVRVVEIEQSLQDAPHWPLTAYVTALDPEATPLRIALVAEDACISAVMGFLVVRFLPPEAELETIAVAAQSQRRGVGRLILDAAVESLQFAQATAAQITKVQLEVRASNSPALAFYRAQGFIETGRRSGYYADPAEDAVLLDRLLL